MAGSDKSSVSKSTTTASGDDTREPGTSGRPLSPTCTVNNSDTANIELSIIMSFQRQQAEMLKNLVSEFASMKQTMC
jgi:hypothetical protein